jgi:asparagine synthase (glutamine-hydrolysing)
MCGFVSILAEKKNLSSQKSLIKKMLDRIAHRGPDGEGVLHIAGQALFGHRRLAIIDIAGGAQPMHSEDERFILLFNGAIYNYIELRQQLKEVGVNFKTSSDTEVLLQLLIYKGKSALPLLNGMFAFIFYDQKENSWIAARDHFGIKPLYFSKKNKELIFASEIKSILEHPEIQAERDNRSLQEYLTFQLCLTDRTLFKNIYKVLPGHCLVGKADEILEDICYWSPKYNIDTKNSKSFFEEKLRFLLNDSMKLQIRSDVPVGGYLSGGLDSSLVCSMASKYLKKPMPVFHGYFKDYPKYNESIYAKEIAQNIKSNYFEIIPSQEDFVKYIPKLIYSLDEPVAGPGVFPQFITSQLASKHVKVVLGGQGGDEIFAGYARYLIGYLEQALKGAILETQEEGKHLVTLDSIVPNLSLLKEYTPLLKHFWAKGFFQNMDERYFHLIDRTQGIKSLLHEDIKQTFNSERLFEDFKIIFNYSDTKSYINKMLHFDQMTLLPALLQIEDRVSMAVSIESRVPILDYRIADLVNCMPPALKFQGGRTKYILKEVAYDLLPKKITNRKDKMGFPVPLEEWMRGGIVRDFVCDTLLSKKSIKRGIYREQALKNMIDQSGVSSRQLWGAFSLELWHQAFIDD